MRKLVCFRSIVSICWTLKNASYLKGLEWPNEVRDPNKNYLASNRKTWSCISNSKWKKKRYIYNKEHNKKKKRSCLQKQNKKGGFAEHPLSPCKTLHHLPSFVLSQSQPPQFHSLSSSLKTHPLSKTITPPPLLSHS